MNEPRLHHVQCLDMRGLHRVAYWEHGDADNPRVLVCVHGLLRQGRDFDTLAAVLASHYRVVCPDVAGRGMSDRLADPMGYALPTYIADMVTLLARLNAQSLDWVGTSMGGLIGLGVASLAGSPVRRLVLNDVGPAVAPAALERIKGYVGQTMSFASPDDAADALRSVSQGFGPHTREQWLALTRPMLRQRGGRFELHYDPAIAVPILALTPEIVAAGEGQLWQAYDRISCPVLLVRGADSDLLTHETALAMTQRGPKATLIEFAGVGHAPTFVVSDQIDAVRQFLLSP